MKENTAENVINKSADALIAELMMKCGFGEVVSPIAPVSGGFMHKMYQVITERGTYAVKHLNPEIMGRPGVHDSYARAEKLERIVEEKGIPIVPAITVDGQKMQHVKGQYFYIFHWQEGDITDWNQISDDKCRIAGNILGRIHAIASQTAAHKEPEASKINWQKYIREADSQGSAIASLLAQQEQQLVYAEQELNQARASLPDIQCITDEDMDPKNVMWHQGNARVIDLECLDYGNPVSGVLQLALQWSGIVTCNMDTEKMAAFFDGYLAAYDNGFRTYSSVFGLAYSWVEWLEYNIQRALGVCAADEAERNMGISEVRNTVNRIRYIHDHEEEIKAALETQFMKGILIRR